MTDAGPMHSPPTGNPKRPKGILKNSHTNSFSMSPGADGAQSPTEASSSALDNDPMSLDQTRRPSLPRGASEKEITQANTIANMGGRRNSSNARSSISASRRQSSSALNADENSPRLKWDEANLYLAEQERGHTMKIDEPKTPWVKQYDEAEDEDDNIAAIDANGVVVDELDKAKNKRPTAKRTESIPDLDIGEPETTAATTNNHAADHAEKRVHVEPGSDEAVNSHGEVDSQSVEARRKHKEFEERRRKHYEMSNVKGMLGHNPDEFDRDGDEPPRVA